MEYRVLGSLEVLRDGGAVDTGGYRQRSLLALLLTSPGTVFSTDAIIDALWGVDGHADRQNSMWVYVSGLRKALDPDREKRSDGSVLLTRSPGYVLDADRGSVDALRFEDMVAEGRLLLARDPAAASMVLGEALSLWRGNPYEEFTYESFAQTEIARLHELRLEAVEARLDADLARGMARELVSELETLVREHPLREAFTGQLMTALHRSGRRAEALRAYQRLAVHLGEELGVEPASRLQQLETSIVTGEADPDAPGRLTAAGPTQPGLAIRGYELREKIASSPMGDAFRAYQPSVGREVVVTVVGADLANDPEYIRSFEAEAQIVAALDTPHVVPLYDYWREPDAAYLVTRHLPGGDLAARLDQGALTPAATAKLIGQLGSALSVAHRAGVAHGDVRSDNVLIDADGNAYLHGLGRGGSATADRMNEDLVGLATLTAHSLTGIAGGIQQVRGALSPQLRDVIDRSATALDDALTIDTFVADLQTALNGEAPPSPAMEIDNPYKGLRAFGAADAHHFHGRERLIERLINRLSLPLSSGRFVALVGPSGSGKSSVARAGLLPALREGAAPQSKTWFTVEMTPAPHPFEGLEEALLSVAVEPPASMIETLLAPHGLHHALERILPADGSQIVLLVDQFEELFTQVDADTADLFIDALADAISAEHSRIRVVATLRADFYDRPLRHRRLGELLREGTEVITPMGAAELERAITGPLDHAGVAFEGALVAELVHDVIDRNGALPLLQYTLTELFDAQTDGMITVDAYRTIGGVSGSLVARANGLLSQLGDEATDVARQVFLRLVTLGEGTGDTRRRVLRSELEQLPVDRRLLEGVLDTFGRHRLLSFDRDPVTRGPTVEISHEALLAEWGRLQSWIDAARHDVRNQRRLAAAMAEWDAAGQTPDYLLRGGRLEQLHGWAETTSLPLAASERNYLNASTAERDREAEEQTVRERRAETAETEARQRARQLRFAAVATVAVTALAAFGIWQWFAADDAREVAEGQRSAAEVARTEAESARDEATQARNDRDGLVTAEEFISASEAAFLEDPELSLLYAVEAVRATAELGFATEEAVDSMHWALQRLGVHFELGPDPATTVRSGPYGLTGVYVLSPAELIDLAATTTLRELTDEECSAAIEEPCPTGTSIVDDLPLRFGDENYRNSLPTIIPGVGDGPLAGTTVTLANSNVVGGTRGLELELEQFTELTGINVRLVPDEGVELTVALGDGTVLSPPDISAVYTPYVPDWAAPRALDLSTFLDADQFRSDFGEHLTELATTTVDGASKLSLVPMNIGPKGLVFYAKPAFEAGGYELPTTHDELVALSATMAENGQTPWCHNWESSFATGWAGTDLLEAMVIRSQGTEAYDDWVSGELPFASPEIVESAHLAEQLLLTPGFVRGGATSILREPFTLPLLELLDTHPFTQQPGPACMFTTVQFSAMNFAGPNTPTRSPGVLGRDIGVFFLPPMRAGEAPTVSGGGSMAFASSDRPEVRALMAYIASPSWGELWAGRELDGEEAFISSNQRFDAEAYGRRWRQFPEDGALRVQVHEGHQAALAAGNWRFDADNQMPPGFATWVEGPAAGPFWQAMVDWVSETKPVEELFRELDEVRPQYE